MSKRSSNLVDTHLEPPCKRQKLIEDEKDSEHDTTSNNIETNTQTKTVTINGESHHFLTTDLTKIDFFNSRYSSKWNNTNECIIKCNFINFGMNELKMAIKYVSNKNNLNSLSNYDLLSSIATDNFSKLLSFLECLDFFCLSSHININNLCDYYYNTKHSTKITISDLFKLQHLNNKLLQLTSIKLIGNIYCNTMNERILSLKEHILKFKIDIDSGFIIKGNDKDASDWFNKKINEFCLYRKYLSRDWIIISKSHESLQKLFILNDLHEPIIATIKDIFDTFCRFCTIRHMHINNMGNDVINIDSEQRKKSNILNDVKICTFPIIQLMSIFLFYIENFNLMTGKNNNVLKQTMDLISLLPTMVKCALFCGLSDSDEYKHCDRNDDLRFINIINNKQNNDKDLYKSMIKIYKNIIDILLDTNKFNFKCLNNDLSIIETLILPITHEIMDDQEWILNLFDKSKQKETILLASKLRNLILDMQLDGHNVNYSYSNNIELYLSYK
eukprot:438546_1